MATGLGYGLLHWAEHFLLALLLAHLLTHGFGIQLSALSSFRIAGIQYWVDLWSYFLIFLFTVLVDADHFKVIAKHGLRYVTDFSRGGKYPFHRLHFLVLFLLLPLVFYLFKLFLLLVISAAIGIHLLWDLVEDLLVFRMGIRNWL